jgi:hypothetical protein
MASSSSHSFSFMGHGFSSSSLGDDEILEQLFVHNKQKQCVFACVIVVANSMN